MCLQCSMAVERSAGWGQKHAADNQRLLALHAIAKSECKSLSDALSSHCTSLQNWLARPAGPSPESDNYGTIEDQPEADPAEKDDLKWEERRRSNAAASTSSDHAEDITAMRGDIQKLKKEMTSTTSVIEHEEQRLQRLQQDMSVARGAITVWVLLQAFFA